jgi:2-dehydro-3-deoxyphosphogalactonate aldolase
MRGLTPDMAIDVGKVLFEAGIRVLEVPLNSPDPLESIRRLVDHFGDQALLGAGTVIDVDSVRDVALAGGRLIVSPNTNTAVIEKTKAEGMVSIPGCLTPTEAFSALSAGADALKLFPGEAVSAQVLKAMRAVLPPHTQILIVGGVSADNMGDYTDAGANGFGIGSWIYRPDRSLAEIRNRARQVVGAGKRFRE